MKPDMTFVAIMNIKRKENPELFDEAVNYIMLMGWWRVPEVNIESVRNLIGKNNADIASKMILPIVSEEYQVKIVEMAQYITKHFSPADVLMVAKCSKMLPEAKDIPYDRLETLCYDMIDVLTINFEYDWELLHKETGITKEEYHKLYNYAEEVNKDVEK